MTDGEIAGALLRIRELAAGSEPRRCDEIVRLADPAILAIEKRVDRAIDLAARAALRASQGVHLANLAADLRKTGGSLRLTGMEFVAFAAGVAAVAGFDLARLLEDHHATSDVCRGCGGAGATVADGWRMTCERCGGAGSVQK